jgi:hypothetical protein
MLYDPPMEDAARLQDQFSFQSPGAVNVAVFWIPLPVNVWVVTHLGAAVVGCTADDVGADCEGVNVASVVGVALLLWLPAPAA